MSNKVLLIHPAQYCSNWKTVRARNRIVQTHLIILYSFLKEHGVDVQALDLENELTGKESYENLNHYFRFLENRINQFSFDIVAISCYSSSHYLMVLKVAQICRKINKNCKIAVGGYHAMAVPEDFILEEQLFDFVIQGDGEIALLEIARMFQGKEKKDTQIIAGTPVDLRQGRWIDWKGYPYSRRGGWREIGFCFSQRCLFNCAYCGESSLVPKRNTYPVSKALRDIKRAIKEVQPSVLFFDDPLFPSFALCGKELLKGLAEADIKIPMMMMTRVDLLDKKQIDLYAKLNVRLLFGVETCSPEMLMIMNKTKNPMGFLRKIEENLPYLNEKGILGDISLMFNHPGDKEAYAKETFKFLKNILREANRISVTFRFQEFFYLPGTYISNHLDYFEREFGAVIKHKTWWKEDVADQIRLAKEVIPRKEYPNGVPWQEHADSFVRFLETKRVNQEAKLLEIWTNIGRQKNREKTCIP